MDGCPDTDSSRIASVLRRSERAATRRVGGVLLLGDPDGGVGVLRVEGAGTLIWDTLKQECTLQALLEQVARAVDTPVGQIEADATTVLQHLIDAKLVCWR